LNETQREEQIPYWFISGEDLFIIFTPRGL